MSRSTNFSKDDIEKYLNYFAEEYKKLNAGDIPLRIVLVGGASILLNYNFRKSTNDIDYSNPLSFFIENAVVTLYDSMDKLPEESIELLDNVFRSNDYEKHFLYFKNREEEARKQLKKIEKKGFRDMVFTDHTELLKKLTIIMDKKFENNDGR